MIAWLWLAPGLPLTLMLLPLLLDAVERRLPAVRHSEPVPLTGRSEVTAGTSASGEVLGAVATPRPAA